jgi:hypothetical protein
MTQRINGTALKSLLGFYFGSNPVEMAVRGHRSTFWIQLRHIMIPYWFLFIVTAIVPLWLMGESVKNRYRIMNRRRQGRCLACGYDLRASAGQCPECGREIDQCSVNQTVHGQSRS